MADLSKIIFINTDTNPEESSSSDTLQFASFKTATYELTDSLLGLLANPKTTSAGAGDVGEYVVLDAGGHIDASMINDADISHANISDLGADDHTIYILADGTRAFSGDQAMGSNKITGLADGSANSDAVNYGQLQSVIAGIDLKESVEYATTAALPTFTGTGTGILTLTGQAAWSPDGTAVVNGQRILVKDEGAADIDHGIFDVSGVGSTVVLTRSSDADSSAEVTSGMFTFVKAGTQNGNSGWAIITSDPITLETTPIEFSQFQGLPAYTASLGVELVGVDFRADLLAAGAIGLTGNEMGVNVDTTTIEISTNALQVVANGINETHIDFGSGANQVDDESIPVADANTNFTATQLNGVLDELYGLATAPGLGTIYAAGAGGVTIGDLCYVSGNDTTLPLPITSTNSEKMGIGLARSTESAAANVEVMANDAILVGVLTAATAGTVYYWTGSALSATAPTAGGAYVWKVGTAKNATDLHVQISRVKKNS